MHIVFDMTYPSRIKTGTHVYAYELLRAIRKSFDDRLTCLAAPGFGGGKNRSVKLLRIISDAVWIQAVLPYRLRQVHADLLFAPSFLVPSVSPIPSVVAILDTMYLVHPEHYDVLWRLWLQAFVPMAVQRAAAIVTISHSSKNDIVKYYHVDPAKINVTHLGVDSKFRQIADQDQLLEVRARYGLDRPYILFVGALERMKNVPRLLEAFSLLREAGLCPRHNLVLLGPTGKGADEIRRTMARLSLADHVAFLGYVPKEDLPRLYNAADLLVLPSLYEGFGLPIVEAMACGTPIVASNTSSIPEVAADAALLFDPTDSSSLAKQIHRALSDVDLRQELIAAGLRRARQFTWESAARRTMEVCRSVALAQPPSPAVGRLGGPGA